MNDEAPRDAEGPDDESGTGLPVLRTWPAVYAFVATTFLIWLGLLAWLTRWFA